MLPITLENILSLVLTLLAISFLVFIHELGHFLAARSVGVRVEKFAIGFGPKLFSFKQGHTEFSLRAIVLGGFVQMYGDSDPSSTTYNPKLKDHPESYLSKNVWEKLWITMAGVLINFVFAAIMFGILLTNLSGVAVLRQFGDYRFIGADSRNPAIVLSDLFRNSDSPAGVVFSIEGESVTDRERLTQILEENYNQPLEVEVYNLGEFTTAEVILNGDGFKSNFDLDFFAINDPGSLINSDNSSAGRLVIGDISADGALIDGRVSGADFLTVDEGPVADYREELRSYFILRVNDTEIYSVTELTQLLESNLGETVELQILSDTGDSASIAIDLPEVIAEGEPILGVSLGTYDAGFNEQVVALRYPNAITAGPLQAINIVGYNGYALAFLIGEAFQGKPDALAENVGSVVAVNSEVNRILGDADQFDSSVIFLQLLNLLALFSAVLAFMNILPIPILDGGNVVFIIIEAIRGKPLPDRVMGAIYTVFFFGLIGLSILVVALDIFKLIR